MNFAKFCELTKLERSFFALPFLATAFLLPLAWEDFHYMPQLKYLWILPAFFSARISGMAFNQWLDWKIDARNPRTAKRLIPTRKVSPLQAAAIAFISLIIFIVSSCVLGICAFGLLAAFLISIYSYLKRISSLCHFVLGGIHFLGVMMLWRLFREPNIAIFCLAASSFFLIAGSDILYALQDLAFDQIEGLHSLPVILGPKKAYLGALFLHFLCLLASIGLYFFSPLKSIYLLGPFSSFLFFLYFYSQKSFNERLFSLCNIFVPFSILGSTSLDLLWRALL